MPSPHTTPWCSNNVQEQDNWFGNNKHDRQTQSVAVAYSLASPASVQLQAHAHGPRRKMHRLFLHKEKMVGIESPVVEQPFRCPVYPTNVLISRSLDAFELQRGVSKEERSNEKVEE